MALARLSIEDALQAAALNFQAGKAEECEEILLEVLKVAPEQAQAHQLLGFVCFQRGVLSQAVEHLQKASKFAPQDVEIRNNLGNFLKSTGDLAAAQDAYQAAIRLDPTCFSAYYNLAGCLANLGLLASAAENYQKCLSLRQDVPEAYYNLAIVMSQLQQTEKCLEMYRCCLQISPDFVQGHVNLGNVLWQEGLVEEAMQSYQQALNLCADSAQIHNNLGVAQTTAGMYRQALQSFERALQLDDKFTDALVNCGIVHRLMGNTQKAIDICHLIIGQNPGQSEPYRHLGSALTESQSYPEAILAYRQALELNSQSYETLLDLGVCSYRAGLNAEAYQAFERAFQIRPQAFAPAWGMLWSQCPRVYVSENQISKLNVDLQKDLEAIEADLRLDNPVWLKEASDFLGLISPHYPPSTQMRLETNYGRIACKIMQAAYGHVGEAMDLPAEDQRIKIGIVSRHFQKHPIYQMFSEGFLSEHNRDKFELYGYCTGGLSDASNDLAQLKCHAFVEHLGFDQMLKRIQADKLQVLIYPDIKDDPLSLKLACLPLAAMQCTTWCQGQASGLRTINHFFSGDLLETRAAQDHYQENLICLPNLGGYFVPAAGKPEMWSLPNLTFNSDAVIYLCGQALESYLPQYDAWLVEICQRVDKAQLVFVATQQGIGEALRSRLRQAFAEKNLDVDSHLTILPQLSAESFRGLCQKSSVFLDAPGLSGFAGALAAIDQNLPLVTMSGPVMRANIAAAILQRMDLTETLVGDGKQYVELAVKLGQDKQYQKQLQESISRRRHMIYHDLDSLRAMEDVICKTLTKAKSGDKR